MTSYSKLKRIFPDMPRSEMMLTDHVIARLIERVNELEREVKRLKKESDE